MTDFVKNLKGLDQNLEGLIVVVGTSGKDKGKV